MKKILIAFLLLISPSFVMKAHATSCIIPYVNEITGGIIYAAQWNANFQAIANCLNNQTLDGTTNIAIGGIGTVNIANLAVTDAKIFGITTAGKVNGSALTGLNNVPSGAGTLAELNIAKLDSNGNGIDGGALISGAANIPSGFGVIPFANLPSGFSTQHVVTGTRSIASIYQNTSGKTMYVTTSLQNTSSSSTFQVLTDSSSSPSSIVAQAIAQTANTVLPVSFIVLNNNYYEITSSASGAVIAWTEWY